jgi:diaminopimelate decarboxylase
VTAFDLSLLPPSAAVDGDGRVSIGGVALAEIASRFGTPCYVYDEEELHARCRAYRENFGDGVAYAGKAFLCVAMAKLVAEEGLHLDVATGGELHVALHAGFPAERIVFHGNNKSVGELRTALERCVGRIVVDSDEEISRLLALIGEGLPAPRVQVRVKPGVEAHTHEFIETGTEDSKFGFSLANGDAFAAACRIIGEGVLPFAGLHCHIGSHVFRLDSFSRAIDKMAGLARAIEQETSSPVAELNVGGGLGVRYLPEDAAPSIAEYAAVLRESVEKALVKHDVQSRPLLMCEPGRSIAAPAGLTLYTIGTIKAAGARTYVAVDGGMSDNLRPVTYGARYETFLPERATAQRPLMVTVAGKHCEQGDVIVQDARVPENTAVGDLLATPVTGAYGHAMASNYNKVTRPPVIFVRNGEARVVVRRESDDDLVRLDSA